MLFDKTALYEYCNKLQALRGQENWIFKRVLDRPDVRKKIIDWNTENQLGDEGINALGQIIGLYSYATEFLSNGRKKAGEPFNLNDTGAFWASFEVRVFNGHITIYADGRKEDGDLLDKYGVDVLGLTDSNLQKLIEFAKELYVEYYRSIL